MQVNNLEALNKAVERKSVFLELEQGKNTVRIVSNIQGVKEHQAKVKDQHRFIACPKAMEEWTAASDERDADREITCPICETGTPEMKKIGTKFLAVAINRKNGHVGVLKKGISVYRSIMDMKEVGVDLAKRDIVITRTGEGLETEYSAVSAPHDSELSESEKSAVMSAGIEIEKMTIPRSYDEINDVLAGKDKYKS